MYEYNAIVNRVVDGDTIDVTLDLGLEVFKKERLRLLGIDTPEVRTKDLEEKEAGLKASKFVSEAIENKAVVIRTYKKGKFGRYLAEVLYLKDHKYVHLNDELIDLGLAKPYGDSK
jgi:micrococcal nuclease